MPSERQLIQRIRELTPQDDPKLVVPVGDDAAVLKWSASDELVVAKDVMVEDCHFRLDWTSPEFLAEKSLSVNLSDLAAMGAQPRGSLLGLTLPSDLASDFPERFLDHFAGFADQMHCPLIGGDLASGNQVHVSVTVLGELFGEPWRRSGGQAGDCLVLIGGAGLAARGLAELERLGTLPDSLRSREALRAFCASKNLPVKSLEALLLPRVYLAEAAWFATHTCVHAAIDISDGLVGDLCQIAKESRLQAVLDWASLQQLREAGGLEMRLDTVIGGGEDYALALALTAGDWEGVLEDYPDNLTPPLRIGELVGGPPGIAVRRGDTIEPLAADHYDHFS